MYAYQLGGVRAVIRGYITSSGLKKLLFVTVPVIILLIKTILIKLFLILLRRLIPK